MDSLWMRSQCKNCIFFWMLNNECREQSPKPMVLPNGRVGGIYPSANGPCGKFIAAPLGVEQPS